MILLRRYHHRQRSERDRLYPNISIYLPIQVSGEISCHRQKHIHVCSSTIPTSARLSRPSSIAETHLIPLFKSRHDMETSETPFGVSPPAHNAEFRSCFIEGRDSYGSEFSCSSGKGWMLLEKRPLGTVLYPLHETCIDTVRRVAKYNGLCKAQSKTMDYTSLQGYYEAILRLHDRLTDWPYGDPDAEEQLSKFHAYPSEYGAYSLAWEHQYYGAARFGDGSEWFWVPGWEVRSCASTARYVKSSC